MLYETNMMNGKDDIIHTRHVERCFEGLCIVSRGLCD